MNQQMFLFFLLFFLALLCALYWPHPGPAQPRAAAKMRRTLRRLLKPRTPDDCPACRLASTAASVGGPLPASVRPWREVKKPAGSPQTDRYRGLRLSQRAVCVLRQHRCSPPCTGWGRQAWPYRADPDVSLSGVPPHLHLQAQHASVSSENPLAAGRHGVVCPG